MTALIIVFSVIFVIIFLLTAKIKLRFKYDKTAVTELRYLFIRIRAEKLIKKFKSDKPEEEKKEQNEEKETPAKKGSFSSFIKFVRHITEVAAYAAKLFLERAYIKVRLLEINIATEDACETALVFGAVNAALNGLFCVVDKFSHLSYNNERMSLSPKFTETKPSAKLDIEIGIRPVSLLYVYIKSYLKFTEV